ncbi:MAG: hypothetical protein MZW92_58575 [Comamonadaceae bacterium]|nr:hypothetical protein [Comamonadaceae bacterium]
MPSLVAWAAVMMPASAGLVVLGVMLRRLLPGRPPRLPAPRAAATG